jgi:hypothetical protein
MQINSPPPRVRFSTNTIKERVWVFGGTLGTKHDTLWNDIYYLERKKGEFSWFQPEVGGDIPRPRYGHSGTVIIDSFQADKPLLYFFGGKGEESMLSEMMIFDTEAFEWKKNKSQIYAGRSLLSFSFSYF